jgi:hypothetical protein
MPVYEPKALEERFEREAAGLSDGELLLKPQHGRLREMWCAARFGIGFADWMTPCQIDIEDVDEQRHYDFHLITQSARYPFQIVEALDEGRKRGDEYKNNTKEELEQIIRARPMRDSAYAARRVAEELKKKLEKYGPAPDLHMLVYVNVNASAVAWATLRNASEDLCKMFASVWAVTENMMCCIWGGTHWTGLVTWRQIE